MSYHSVDFHDVSTNAFDAFKVRLVDIGFDVPSGNSGPVNGRMVAGVVDHDPATQILRIRVDSLPPATTPGFVIGWVEDCLYSVTTMAASAPQQ